MKNFESAYGLEINKKRSACAAERKSVNPLLAGGCAACRLSLSVHKQTSPIDIDHLKSAPEFIMWIKIIRTPNTADQNQIFNYNNIIREKSLKYKHLNKKSEKEMGFFISLRKPPLNFSRTNTFGFLN